MTPEEIQNQSMDITLTEAARGQNNRFCELWPSAKQGLVLLRDFIKNPIVKATVTVIISAGDAVSSQICGNANS